MAGRSSLRTRYSVQLTIFAALEDLVKSLRSHLARLTHDVEESKTLITHLKSTQPPVTFPPSPPRPGTASELATLRREIERLSGEVSRLTGVVERGLETRRVARGEQAARISDEEDYDAPPGAQGTGVGASNGPELAHRTSEHLPAGQNPSSRFRSQALARPSTQEPRLPSKLRQGLHASASTSPTLMPPSTGPPTRIQAAPPRGPPTPPPEEDEEVHQPRLISDPGQRQTTPPISHSSGSRSSRRTSRAVQERQDGPDSPFPSIRAEDEAEFFAIMEEQAVAGVCTESGAAARTSASVDPPRDAASGPAKRGLCELHPGPSPPEDILRYSKGEVPPQTVLARVIRELEDDFAHYKA